MAWECRRKQRTTAASAATQSKTPKRAAQGRVLTWEWWATRLGPACRSIPTPQVRTVSTSHRDPWRGSVGEETHPGLIALAGLRSQRNFSPGGRSPQEVTETVRQYSSSPLFLEQTLASISGCSFANGSNPLLLRWLGDRWSSTRRSGAGASSV